LHFVCFFGASNIYLSDIWPPAEEPLYIYDSDDGDVSEETDYSEDEFANGDDVADDTGPENGTAQLVPAVDAESHGIPAGDAATAGNAAALQLPEQTIKAVKAASIADGHVLADSSAQAQAAAGAEVSVLTGSESEKGGVASCLVSLLHSRITKLSRHMSQKLQMSSALSLGMQQAKQFTQKSIAKAGSDNPEALSALAHSLHEKLAQTQLELADIKEYRAAAEHRQRLAAAAASMAAFTEDRLQVHRLSHTMHLSVHVECRHALVLASGKSLFFNPQ